MIYKVKRFAKVWKKEGFVDIKDLDDEQLKNVAKYLEDKRGRKNADKLYKKLVLGTTVSGAMGGIAGGSPGSIILGTGLGAATGAAWAGLAHGHHTKNAKAALKELEKRRNK